jgi:hypothetical protein
MRERVSSRQSDSPVLRVEAFFFGAGLFFTGIDEDPV